MSHPANRKQVNQKQTATKRLLQYFANLFQSRKQANQQIAAKDINAGGNVTIEHIVQTIIQIVKPDRPRSLSIMLAQGGLVIFILGLLVAAINGKFSPSNAPSITYAPSTTVENKNTYLISKPPLSLLSKAPPSEAEKKDAQQKVSQYQQEVQKNPNSAVAHTNLGEALRRTGDLEGARKEHQEALQLTPDLQAAKVGLALVDQEQAKLEAAIKAIQDALTQEKDPKVLAFIYFYLGTIFYIDQEPPDIKSAEVAFQKSIELDPNLAESYLYLGSINVRQEKLKEGLAYLEKARTLFRVRGDIKMVKHTNKGLGLALNLWATILGKESKFDQAVAESQKAIVLYPNYAEAHHVLGAALFAQGKQKEAIKSLKKARDLYRLEGKIQETEKIEGFLQKAGVQ